jgi:hypothetical protein
MEIQVLICKPDGRSLVADKPEPPAPAPAAPDMGGMY